jgi:hypothetical protein
MTNAPEEELKEISLTEPLTTAFYPHLSDNEFNALLDTKHEQCKANVEEMEEINSRLRIF